MFFKIKSIIFVTRNNKKKNKMKKVLFGVLVSLSLLSCNLDDDIYIDCDCGNVTGWSSTTITIQSDCGGFNTYYDVFTNVYVGQYICFN